MDGYLSRSKTATTNLRIELRGSGFNQGVGGIPSTGTVRYFGIVDPVPDFTKLVMWDFSVPIGSFLTAILTNIPTDDTALFLSILTGNDRFYLSDFADSVAAEGGDDEIWGDAGNDLIFGESGVDTANFTGAKSAYTITQGAVGVFTITGPDGIDTVRSVEFAVFDGEGFRLRPAPAPR